MSWRGNTHQQLGRCKHQDLVEASSGGQRMGALTTNTQQAIKNTQQAMHTA